MKAKMQEEKFMRFPDGKSKAVTFSYDDSVEANAKLLRLFDKYGVKATFNLNSRLFGFPEWNGQMGEERFLEIFSDCGQEIALHGARHIFLDKVPLAEAAKEITDNREYLENAFGIIADGMAYAYGAYNDEIVQMLKMLGVKYARTTVSSYGFEVPRDWLRLKPTCHHTEKEFPRLAERFFASSPENEPKNREPWLFYLWGHAHEFDNDGNWDLIENFLKRVSADNGIWLATNGEVYDYVQAYNRLEYSLDGERVKNPSATDVFIELRGKVYRVESGKQLGFDG